VAIKKVPASFYQNSSGSEPVRKWLKDLSPEDRKIIGDDIATVEYGWPVGMPLCEPLRGGVWEIRSRLGDRIARVLFSFYDGKLILLHGIIKKTKKTPGADIDLAIKRKKEVENAK